MLAVVFAMIGTAAASSRELDGRRLDGLFDEAELVFEATVVAIDPHPVLWLLGNDKASSQEYCTATLQIEREVVGSVVSGKVDTWYGCGLADASWGPGSPEVGQRVWMSATRFRGGASGFPKPGTPLVGYPPADDVVVPSSFNLYFELVDSDWKYALPITIMAGLPCVDELQALDDELQLILVPALTSSRLCGASARYGAAALAELEALARATVDGVVMGGKPAVPAEGVDADR